MTDSVHHLHLVSDATGETIGTIARACLVQFEGIRPAEYFWSLIRTRRQLEMVFDGLSQRPGLVLYTFVDDDLRLALEGFCQSRGLPCVSVLDPVLKSMAGYFGKAFTHDPGRQHTLDANYFARIDAMDFALAQDDGNGAERLRDADVVILGVSRTSKTPTSLYLANRGIKAANIPIVSGCPLPEELNALSNKLIVGLTKDPDSLVEIRRNRLKHLHESQETSYADPDQVRDEVQQARRLFARMNIPVIDVTRRSIEETAAEILMLLARQRVNPS